MVALCVDDERLPLQALERAVRSSPFISSVHSFDDEREALDWAEDNPIDIAFLDIELRDMNGIDVARQLLDEHPRMAVVFCTSYEQYAIRALQLHIDAGYIMKPIRKAEIATEIAHVAEKKKEIPKLKAVCFGNFTITANGAPLEFKRSKTKELLAYLIDQRGTLISSTALCSVLWEDRQDDEKLRDYFYHLTTDLRGALKQADAEDALISNARGFAIRPEAIDCDYYRYLEGDEAARRSYTGEYMFQYDWAEETNAWLQLQINENTTS